MIQLTTRGPRIVKDDEWAAQQQEFAQRHCVVLKDFVDESLASKLVRMAETGQYEVRDNGRPGVVVGRELTMRENQPLARVFDMLLNQRRLFDAIAELTGATREISAFAGRGFKRIPDLGHFSRWHNDCGLGRLYGLGVSLSTSPASGGVFKIRRNKTKEILQVVPPLKLGDARLFRIHWTLDHIISLDDKPYCGYAGWFVGGKKNRRYQEVMREALVRR